MSDLIQTLTDADVNDKHRVTLLNGPSIEGGAAPINYVPEEHTNPQVSSVVVRDGEVVS